MTDDLKILMSNFGLISEAELYASDLKYKCLDNLQKKQFASEEIEESMGKLLSQLKLLTDRYARRFNNLVSTHMDDPYAETHVAIALYLSTYFDENNSCKRYYKENVPELVQFVHEDFAK